MIPVILVTKTMRGTNIYIDNKQQLLCIVILLYCVTLNVFFIILKGFNFSKTMKNYNIYSENINANHCAKFHKVK